MKKQTEYLKLILPEKRFFFKEKKIIIEPLDGLKTIFEAKNVFPSYIDLGFKKIKSQEYKQESPETRVCVYEMLKNARLFEMFYSLSPELNGLCLTQNQIIIFCKKYFDYLRRDNNNTFFLLKEDEIDHFFVACVRLLPSGLSIFLDSLGSQHAYVSSCLHRIVVPERN